ncbi:hypothetical protein [Arthrobacter sp. PsM3]|uniref:hypothetical protein n=1 Tax=Arthrobacter sp. PsM3 TaxID=3030531 RepID=UPI00263BBF8E|nr:hypothetical protein [Arthrobacter sp. PsM3]MDN4645363.1 hypothetical protein [Arthrobacter sp. PsM3]
MGRPIGRKSITVLTAQKSLDPYSQEPVDDWTLPPAETTVTGCEVEPGTTQEYLLNRDQVLVAWTVFAPAGTQVSTYNRVRFNGNVYTVYGHPAEWDSPSGRLNYVEIVLQDWRG